MPSALSAPGRIFLRNSFVSLSKYQCLIGIDLQFEYTHNSSCNKLGTNDLKLIELVWIRVRETVEKSLTQAA